MIAHRPVVLVGHGTADPAGQQVAMAIHAQVAAALPGVEVAWAWVDVIEPRLPSVLGRLPDAVVVPIFLASGYHVRVDIPQAVAGTGGRALVTPAVGPDLVPVVAERLQTAWARAGGSARDHPIVLAAAGSSRPEALAEVRRAADVLAGLIDLPVQPAFVTAAEPRVDTLVAEHDGLVSLASWLLAPGHFQDRLARSGAAVVSAPIGSHRLLVEVILDRITTVPAPGAVVNGVVPHPGDLGA